MTPLRAFVLACVLLLPAGAGAQAPPPDRELVVATKEAPPFAMKGADGAWQGIAIDLWRHIADQLHLRYRFSEVATVQDLLDATTNGSNSE